MESNERYSFVVEWYDDLAALTRKYQFSYYPKDNTVDMHDLKNNRAFLRRCKADNIQPSDLYIGSTINFLSRQLKFVEYGDLYTQNMFGRKTERTLGMIKPDAVQKLGPILDMICRSGLTLTQLKMCKLSREEAFQFYTEHQSKPFFNALVTFMTSGAVIVFELMGISAVGKWRELLGPTDSSTARSQAPQSIRARFGTDQTKNACHGSDADISAARELEFFFPTSGPGRQNTAVLQDSTCCVIKPHAVKSGLAGRIIEMIQQKRFEITAMQMYKLEQANAEEFFEVYKGVVQEYPQMVNELTSGPCIALEIKSKEGSNTPVAFREMVGPPDPEIARQLKPTTLRAQFGKDKVQNAVHCTDLPEDGLLDVEYFFRILDH